MTIVCPACSAVRPPESSAPDWQCPACKKAYVKAGTSYGAADLHAYRSVRLAREVRVSPPEPFPWTKIAWAAAVVLVLSAGLHHRSQLRQADEAARQAAMVAGGRRVDVVLYSTTSCPYCAAARSWMSAHEVAFRDCNIERDEACRAEFMRRHPRGVPYMLVRGQEMTGFNAEQLQDLLLR